MASASSNAVISTLPPPLCTADTERSLAQLDEPTPDDCQVEAEACIQLSANK